MTCLRQELLAELKSSPQQLRRTADEKFKIEAESYLSLTLCEETQSMYSQNSLLFWRDYGNNFPTLQVFAVFRNVGRFGGSGEPLNSLD